MARKTGRYAKVEVEVGATFYALAALSTVSSPAADVGKKFLTSAVFISDHENRQPVVRLDGVISGLNLSPGSGYNEVDFSAGSVYIKGAQVDVTAGTVIELTRPTSSGQIKTFAICVDENGTVAATAGTAGAPSTTRGAAGGPPYLPLDQVLIGYVNMSYYGGSESGAAVVTAAEIDNETKERATIPSYQVKYHDGKGSSATNYGVIEFATALPLIHNTGASRRNVYASYYSPTFEQIQEAKDFSFSQDVNTYKSKAYLDESEETALGTEMWSGSGTVYWSKVDDLLSVVINSKRWVKIYPDINETGYVCGRCIVKANKSLPLEDTMSASVTLEGSGALYVKTS